MSGVTQLREIVHEELRTGLSATSMLDGDPPALRVSWISWDSGFRGSGLRIGDRITAVDGQVITRPADIREVQRNLPLMIGQWAEPQAWEKRGLKDGAPITLTVRRRRVPGHGWEALDITGKVLADRAYSDEAGRRALGPTGPDSLMTDGFSDPWSSWYEKRVSDWTRVLDGGWQTKLDTRQALARHLEEKPRVDFVTVKCPGPFADALAADWEAVRTSLAGTRYDLPAEALDFRELEEERSRQIAAAAVEAWDAMLERYAAEIADAAHAIDPMRGDRSQIVGRLVALPAMSQRQWVMSIGRNFLSANLGGSWYFVAADTPAMQRAFLAVHRYKRHVSPAIREDIAVFGRILPDPRMMVVQAGGVAGFELEPLAVMIGNAMSVDLAVVHDGASPFAGEDRLRTLSAGLPPDTATPPQVLEALVAALKAGDQEVWNALFADWRFVADDDRPIYYPYYPYAVGSRDEAWIRSRRHALATICDVRVVWVSEPRVLQRGDEYEGAPRIEQVEAELDHVGLFDGEHRAFNSIDVNRLWTLQRRDDGPWRVSSQHGI